MSGDCDMSLSFGQVVGCFGGSLRCRRGYRSARTLDARDKWPRTAPASVSSMARYSCAARTALTRKSEVRWWMFRVRAGSSAIDAISAAT